MVRFIRRLFALLRGTFVADCPHCHRHFYGFHPHLQQVSVSGKHYRIVCHRCAVKITKIGE